MKRSALFLDRDGVVNVDYGYVQEPANFHFTDGIAELCSAAKECNRLIVITTNQSGIGRGYYSEQKMRDLHSWMLARLAERNVFIDAIYHCPFHPEAVITQFRGESFDRKPNPGMLLRAAADLDIELETSILVGDKQTDIEAGERAGIGTLVLFDKTFPAEPIKTLFGFQSGSLRSIARFFRDLSFMPSAPNR